MHDNILAAIAALKVVMSVSSSILMSVAWLLQSMLLDVVQIVKRTVVNYFVTI